MGPSDGGGGWLEMGPTCTGFLGSTSYRSLGLDIGCFDSVLESHGMCIHKYIFILNGLVRTSGFEEMGPI